jgi:type IV pilus assembly protein PilP
MRGLFIFIIMTTLGAVLYLGVGCGEPPPPPATPKVQVEETPVEKPKEQQNYFYTPIGKRDPFRPFYLDVVKTPVRQSTGEGGPLEQFELEQLKLVGILTGMETPMSLIQDPSGKGYAVGPGTPIGRNGGRISRITKDEVVVEEEYYNSEGKRIINKISLRLKKEDEASSR